MVKPYYKIVLLRPRHGFVDKKLDVLNVDTATLALLENGKKVWVTKICGFGDLSETFFYENKYIGVVRCLIYLHKKSADRYAWIFQGEVEKCQIELS